MPGARERAKRTADQIAPTSTTVAPTPLATPARTRGITPKWSLPIGMPPSGAMRPWIGALSTTPIANPVNRIRPVSTRCPTFGPARR